MRRLLGERWLMLIVAAHLGLGLLYMWATPIFEASDEGFHYGVIQWIVRGNGLPVQTRTRPATLYGQEGSQPPLYYLLGAGLTFWMPTRDFEQVFVQNPLSQVGYVGAAHNINLYRPAASGETARAVAVIRLFSLGLSLGTLVLTERLARRLTSNPALALLATAAVAFNPMVIFINAAINNDNLVMLLSTAALLMAVQIVQARAVPSGRQLAGLGVLGGLAALTKVSGLVLWPIMGLALVWNAWQLTPAGPFSARILAGLQTRGRASLLWQGGVVLGVTLALSGWWFLRNQWLYGELAGVDTMAAIAGLRTISLWDLVTHEWYGFYMSFWGIFGAFTLLPGVWAQWVFHALTLVAGLGGLLSLARRRAAGPFEAWLLACFCLFTFVGVVRWTMTTPASQGRLLFGAIAPLGLGLAAGWLALFPQRWSGRAALAIGGVLAVVAGLIPIVDIAPRYTPSPPITAAALPADLHPVHAQIGDGMELVGYTSEAAPRHPGETQSFTLYWQARAPMPQDYALALVMFGRGHQPAGQIDTWPGAGLRPTSQWQAGALYVDRYELPIRADIAAPTQLKLSVGVWSGRPENRLPILIPDGTSLTAVTFPVGRVVPAQPPAVAPAVAETSTFENGLTLLGYDMVHDSTLTLTLYWRADQALTADYTVFVHFLNDAGQEVLPPADAPPLNGDWPTSAWVPGQVVVDRRSIALSPDLSATDCCSIQVGWYDPATGARLAAFQRDGAPWPDNAVLLRHAFTLKR